MALQSSIVDTVTLPLTVHLSTLVFPIPHKLAGKPDKFGAWASVCWTSKQSKSSFFHAKEIGLSLYFLSLLCARL